MDTEDGGLSPQEQATIDAIVAARSRLSAPSDPNLILFANLCLELMRQTVLMCGSEHPLSIVVVGVGDGPWDMMREFDDNIPARGFDNFQV